MRRFLTIFGVLASSSIAMAQEPGPLSIELNTTQSADNTCTVTFMVTNDTGEAIDKAVFETVLFGPDGAVQSLTLFDFGNLPQKRPRVRQFAVPYLSCNGLSRILFNGANTCTSSTASICDERLKLKSRMDSVEVLG